MKFLSFAIALIFISIAAYSQQPAVVTSLKLNVRSGPSKDSSIVAVLLKNDTVSVLEHTANGFCKISFKDTVGFVSQHYLMVDEFLFWQKKKYSNGEAPTCENIKTEFDQKINNYLKVNVGRSTDVVLKLMKIVDSLNVVCIRKVYINGGSTFTVKNIPEGFYYLKIAYGKDWRETIIDLQCYGTFAKNPLYKKGDDILDYNREFRTNGYSIPSYELWLDVVSSAKNNFSSKQISAAEFNK